MSATRVTVTGATGHLGSNLVRTLLERGDEVRILMRLPERPESIEGLDLDIVRGDVRDKDAVRRAVEGSEIVFHLAAQISITGPMGGLVHDVNVNGAANVARQSLSNGVRRMVHVCSIHAFSQTPLDEALDETRTRVTKGSAPAYDVSKAEGEAQVRRVVAEGLDAVIVHPSAIIGPNDFAPSRMGKVLLDLYRKKLPGLVPGGFNWVDVRDVVRGTLEAAERGRTNESYLLGGHWHSVKSLAAIAESITGVAPPRLSSPMWLAQLGAPFMQLWANLTRQEPLYTSEALVALRANRNYDLGKSGSELGYHPRPTDETVRDTYRWFAENGRLPESLLERIEAQSAP